MDDLLNQDLQSERSSQGGDKGDPSPVAETYSYLHHAIIEKRSRPEDYPRTPGKYDSVWQEPEPQRSQNAGEDSSLVTNKNKWDNQAVKSCKKPLGLHTNRVTGKRVPANCGSWDCPYCGKVKKIKLLKRVDNGFAQVVLTAGQRVRSITLTQVLGSKRNIMEDWAALRHMLVRAGYHLKYFWTKEFTKKGQRHLHILVNAYISQKTLSLMWRLCTDGESYITWINCHDNEGASGDIYNPGGYMSKYMTKAYGDEVKFDKKEHRYGFSRDPLFKAQKYNPIPDGLSPIQVLEYCCFPSTWVMSRSVASMVAAYRMNCEKDLVSSG